MTFLNKSIYLTSTHLLQIYVFPMLITCGFVLNFFSFFVMKRITTTTTTTKTAKYMSYLALIDSGVLFVGGLNLLTHSTSYNHDFLAMTSVISCKLVPFLFYTLADYSVFIIVIMTAETCVDLWKKRRNNTSKSFQNYLLIGFFACLIINSHFILTHNLLVTQNDFSDYNEDLNELTLNASSLILSDPNQNVCIYVIWKEFYEKYWIYLDASIYSFIPFVFISIFNLLIVCSLTNTKNCFSNNTTENITITTNSSQPQRLNNYNTHLISILITINISFCVLSIPMVILQIVYYLYVSKKTINEQSISSLISLINNQNSEMYSSLFITADLKTILKSQEKNKTTDEFVDLLHVIAELLQYLNHGSNFVLCLLTSNHFKKETKLFLISIYSSVKKMF
jgi:hypothetical protein